VGHEHVAKSLPWNNCKKKKTEQGTMKEGKAAAKRGTMVNKQKRANKGQKARQQSTQRVGGGKKKASRGLSEPKKGDTGECRKKNDRDH